MVSYTLHTLRGRKNGLPQTHNQTHRHNRHKNGLLDLLLHIQAVHRNLFYFVLEVLSKICQHVVLQ